MKNVTCTIIVIWTCLVHEALSQHPRELQPGYYVVVAAYAPSREDKASQYTELLKQRGYKALYGFNSRKNFFFVYLNYFTDLKQSLRDMENTRKQAGFSDAWVRVVSGDVAAGTTEAQPTADTSQPTEPAKPFSPVEPPLKTETIEEKETKESTAVTTDSPQQAVSTPNDIEVTDNPPIKQYETITLENTEVFLSLYNAQNDRVVEGEVKVVDTDRAKLLKEVKGNEYLTLPDPKSKTGQITLICEAFGYRKIQHEINYPVPLSDTAKSYIDLLGTTFVVNFDLVRYHKGDVGTLFHVYFFNDAAIMMPESKYELNTLLQMMKENPDYKIRLHGHTNGNYHGRIITMGPEKNFFSLDGSKSTVGSAKDLSFNRAEVIKEFLEANGVDPARIEVKAWGGKRPLYDRHGANARKNVRVEVEILED